MELSPTHIKGMSIAFDINRADYCPYVYGWSKTVKLLLFRSASFTLHHILVRTQVGAALFRGEVVTVILASERLFLNSPLYKTTDDMDTWNRVY